MKATLIFLMAVAAVTVISTAALAQEQVTFQAGTHADAVTIRMDDYKRIAQPGVGHFCRTQ